MELILADFPDSVEFQCWKDNLDTEICSKSADPHLKEIEIVKSTDDLMTSRSIVGRNDFPDVDMLDATIASALNKLLDTQIHFRKRVSVEKSSALTNTNDS